MRDSVCTKTKMLLTSTMLIVLLLVGGDQRKMASKALLPPKWLAFKTAGDLRTWLSQHHSTEKELSVRVYKKASKIPSLTWDDVVLTCLAFGWIDGRKNSLDADSYLQRITPRTNKSQWSQRNKEHVERLTAQGLMMPSGLAAVNAAKNDNRWDDAYAGPATMEIPEDFLQALEAHPEAKAFYATLNRTNLYSIYHKLHSAKRPATRARRMQSILDQLARNEKFQ
jgi:uncharacterized protein YdeI (YjbR/CyaY-like superfamily)